ncbi:MAG: polysaccharide deacetylase family protein [Eubacteriales bacterium]
MKRVFTLFLLTLLLTACSHNPAQVSQNVGVGRETKTILPQNITAKPPTENETGDTIPVPGTSGALWELVDGRYVYHFPPRDDSGLSDLSDLSAVQYIPFEDQPDDWFFGKTERDASTGEVTYIWDRAQSTLDLLEQYNGIYRGDESQKVCYLTFDCGYELGTMSSILDTLKEKAVPATFFVNGNYVNTAGDMIQRMLDEGHIVANHCVNHYDLTTVSAETFLEEVQGLEDLFCAKFPNAGPMRYFRPPSGSSNEWVLRLADKMGYITVMWSWAYYDYDTANQPDVASVLEQVKLGLHNGCVYLLHPESTTNTAMLGPMIDWIRSVGYEILPLCAIE